MAVLIPRYHSNAASEYSTFFCLYNCARSLSALGVMLTRYALLGFKLGEKFPRGPRSSFFHIFQTPTDAFLRIRAGGKVEQALIGFGILHDGRCLPVYRQHHRALAFLKLFQ